MEKKKSKSLRTVSRYCQRTADCRRNDEILKEGQIGMDFAICESKLSEFVREKDGWVGCEYRLSEGEAK